MSTRQQRWAREVHQIIISYRGVSSFEKKYRALSRTLPSLLQQSGLIQGLIFAETRTDAKDPQGVELGKALVRDLAKVHSDISSSALIKQIQEAELSDYLRLSEELIDLAVWFRRYATVLLKSEDTGS
jgi:CRISPR-associated protein Cmr5